MQDALARPQKDTTPQKPSGEWKPGQIQSLRKSLDLNQTDFGLRIFDSSPASAQRKVSQLENGDYKPGAAVRKHLERLKQEAEQQATVDSR